LGHVQGRKDSEQFGDVVGLDALLRTFAVQLLQTLVSEAQDHSLTVSRNVSRYNHVHPRLVGPERDPPRRHLRHFAAKGVEGAVCLCPLYAAGEVLCG
jgi:hypothetical protein